MEPERDNKVKGLAGLSLGGTDRGEMGQAEQRQRARTTAADRVAFISQKTWRYMSQTFKSSRPGQTEVNEKNYYSCISIVPELFNFLEANSNTAENRKKCFCFLTLKSTEATA